MMTKNKLEMLQQYYNRTRAVGHTTLMCDGLYRYHRTTFVMSHGHRNAETLALRAAGKGLCKPLSWLDITPEDFAGEQRPIAWDNLGISAMINDSLTLINEAERMLVEANDKIAEFKAALVEAKSRISALESERGYLEDAIREHERELDDIHSRAEDI